MAFTCSACSEQALIKYFSLNSTSALDFWIVRIGSKKLFQFEQRIKDFSLKSASGSNFQKIHPSAMVAIASRLSKV